MSLGLHVYWALALQMSCSIPETEFQVFTEEEFNMALFFLTFDYLKSFHIFNFMHILYFCRLLIVEKVSEAI